MKKERLDKWTRSYLLNSLTGQEEELNKIILFRLAFIAGVLLIVFLIARR